MIDSVSDFHIWVTAVNFVAEYGLILFFFSSVPNHRTNARRVISLVLLLLISFLYFIPFNHWERQQTGTGSVYFVQTARLCYYFLIVWLYLICGKDRKARDSAYLSLYYISFYGVSRIYLILVSILTAGLASHTKMAWAWEMGARVLVLAMEYATVWMVRRLVPLERIINVRPFRFFLVSGISLLSVFFRCTMILAGERQQMSNIGDNVIFPFFTALAFTLFLILFESWQAVEEERKQLSVQKAMRSYELQQSTASAEISKEVRRLHHDMKNHLLAIRSMGESTAGVQEYIDSILGRMEPFEDQVQTGITFMNAYVSEKLRTMKQMQVSHHVSLNLMDLTFIDPVDLLSIIGNVMDNAIEALQNTPEKERVFTATSSRFANTVLLRFDNSYSGILKWAGNLPSTLKKDKENHGFGIKTIQKTVEQYGGSISISPDPERKQFRLTILIPVPEVAEASLP